VEVEGNGEAVFIEGSGLGSVYAVLPVAWRRQIWILFLQLKRKLGSAFKPFLRNGTRDRSYDGTHAAHYPTKIDEK